MVNKLKKGFTLVELLVVIAIIGILATIMYMQYQKVQARARDTQRIRDFDNIKYALLLYKQDNGNFPGCEPPTEDLPNCLYDDLVKKGKYLESLPEDPKKQPYEQYKYSNSSDSVILKAFLEVTDPVNLDGAYKEGDCVPGTLTPYTYCINIK